MSSARHRTAAAITDVILGSNPGDESRYTYETGYSADISTIGAPQPGWWSAAVNISSIHLGTLAWIARFTGGRPELAGWLVVEGMPQLDDDDGIWYVPGILCGWTQRLCIPADDLIAAGWSANQAPFGTKPQFQTGRRVYPGDLDAIVACMDPSQRVQVADEYQRVNGTRPHWWHPSLVSP